MAKAFTGVRAPSTLGTFLRTFSFGHVRQLDAVNARLLAGLAERVPRLLAALLLSAAIRAFADARYRRLWRKSKQPELCFTQEC